MSLSSLSIRSSILRMHRCLHPRCLRGQGVGPSWTTRGRPRSSSPAARFITAFPPPLHLTFKAPVFATTSAVTFRRCYHGAQDAANAGARAWPQDPPRRGGGGCRAAGRLCGGGRAVCPDALSPLVSFGAALLGFFASLVWAEVRPGRWGGGAGSVSRGGKAPDSSFFRSPLAGRVRPAPAAFVRWWWFFALRSRRCGDYGCCLAPA